MPGMYSQLLLHIVFSTKNRQPWIRRSIADRLYSYIGGIVRQEGGALYEIGGIEDHLHLLVRWRTDAAVSDLMRVVKTNSSRWIHSTFADLTEFAWQEGYAAFSVSKSQEAAVKKHLAMQEEHHRREGFRSEFLRLLQAHGVEFDDRYVFD
jgi:REP-associated tyrosine transposase